MQNNKIEISLLSNRDARRLQKDDFKDQKEAKQDTYKKLALFNPRIFGTYSRRWLVIKVTL